MDSQPTPAHPTWLGAPSSARDVLYQLLVDGPLSRSALAEKLGLSAGSLTRVTKPLLTAGEIIETESRHVGPTGRPTQPLEIVAGRHYFVGVKLTGTHASAALVNLRTDVIATAEAPIGSMQPEAVADLVADLVRRVEQSAPQPVAAVGVCLGGQVTDGGNISWAPFLKWENVPFGDLLKNRLGLPVSIINDLNALTLMEHWLGSGRGIANLVVLTIGAGVGYGLVINHQMITDANSGLGTAGHIPLDPFGPPCDLGHRGCANVMLSQPSLESRALASMGRPVPYAELLELSAQGGVAKTLVDEAGFALGRLLTIASALVMPELIILSGEGVGLATAAREAIDAGRRHDREVHAREVPIAVIDVDDTHWARGAAIGAMQQPAPS
ncbi:ROK family transcriptional regulator [Arthrobacter sp. MMS18-M83]|uniref:ROK family transcriptional regulator n=1 Tax=Arthrobacter sp. MMS18-M83 TaxID=2996261 RepID=UPI00227D40A6|nr:ROK family transcriptional regulator [Arthrobacter sp. MMS18-M83]WAH99146.1 ROK family transcriptional regulator [Arthrobacter sp. MMS18-M83]